ncbi:MAG: hypothetical protein HQK83_06305 [Fibrobacteria bacterium]|nr:hypothetical protein [Fibrobacteria bacterium]
MHKLISTVSKCDKLVQSEKHRMFELMCAHFAGMKEHSFFTDLREKNNVILLKDQTGTLQGFSTLLEQTLRVQERECTILFSGDTIVDRQYWGHPELAKAWGRYAFDLVRRSCQRPVYWILMTQGYRTYKFLSVYFREFWPHPYLALPLVEKEIRDQFMEKKYGSNYNKDKGIVPADKEQYCLRHNLWPAPLDNVYYQLFIKANPGFGNGDELVCIAPVTKDNLKQAAFRFAGVPSIPICTSD